jgi:hypothetical protein
VCAVRGAALAAYNLIAPAAKPEPAPVTVTA